MSARERYLTIAQAAASLQMNAEVLRRMCRDGRIPAAKFGDLWRIRQSDLNAMFAIRQAGGRWPRRIAPTEGTDR